MTEKVVNMFEEKQKMQSLFTLENATKDVEKYKEVVERSILEFSSYSVFEKQSLYETLAKFNVELLQKLLERKRDEQ